jgi:hypothetical protein
MASEDGSSVELRREQRIAAHVVKRFGLTPPVDVQRVVRTFADIERDWIPGACDGLVLGLHAPRRRPLVLLKRGRPLVRERFTLAHELGHILLPWHIGDGFPCETSRERSLSEPEVVRRRTRGEPLRC